MAGQRQLARIVRTNRERLELTQAELAKRVGVSRSAISEIENGRIHAPRAGVFSKLARVLGVPGAVLLAATGYAVGDPVLDIEADELLLLAASIVQMSAGERRWVHDRLLEVRDLLTVRRRKRGGRRKG